VGEERVALEHGVDAAAVGRDVVDPLAVDEHVPARGGLEAGDEAEDGGLAAARRAEDGQELAALDI
jgi:hypothetical protein